MPTIINNSTFLDAYGAGQYTSQQYQTVAAATLSTDARVLGDANQAITDLFQYGPTASTFSAVRADTQITVGLMLERAAPQSQLDTLLGGSWGQRQAALAAFPDQAALWATYGADVATYNTVQAQVQAALAGITGADPFAAATAAGYISTAADRTLWLTVNRDQFTALFNSALFEISNSNPQTVTTLAWTGNLAFNDAISSTSAAAIQGVWIERDASLTNPLVTASTLVAPTLGPLGIGNAADTAAKVVATPAALAASYNFPLPTSVATDAGGAGRDRLRQHHGVDERLQPVPPGAGPGPGDAAIRLGRQPRRLRERRAHPRHIGGRGRGAQQHHPDVLRPGRHAVQRLPADLLRRQPPRRAVVVLPPRRPVHGQLAVPVGVPAAHDRRRAGQRHGAHGGRRRGRQCRHCQRQRQRHQRTLIALHDPGRRHVDRDPVRSARRPHPEHAAQSRGPEHGAAGPGERSRDRVHHGRRRPEDAAQPPVRGNTGARGGGHPADQDVRDGLAGADRHAGRGARRADDVGQAERRRPFSRRATANISPARAA